MKHNKHVDISMTEETSRDRREVRTCLAREELSWLDGKDRWEGLKSCVLIESKRTIEEKTTVEKRFYISYKLHLK